MKSHCNLITMTPLHPKLSENSLRRNTQGRKPMRPTRPIVKYHVTYNKTNISVCIQVG